MPATGSRRTPEELAHLGAEVFDRLVRPTLRPEADHKFVAIDVESGAFEIDDDDYRAVMRSRRQSADLWLGRIGQPAAYLIGLGF